MFSDKKSKTPAINGNQQNRITDGTSITGDLTSNSGMRIDGYVQGTIKTQSKVVLGENGVIKGTLDCENADIEGKFSGNMTISGTLTLRATAQIDGDVVAGKLAIEPGATFNATCVMKGSVKKLNNPKEEATNQAFSREERSASSNVE